MHACFLIPELVAKIAEACAPGYKNREPGSEESMSMGTLYALARTCRALQEPALDMIWYHQINLNNLINLMPENFWSCGYRVINSGVVCGGKCGTLPSYDEMVINTSPLPTSPGTPELPDIYGKPFHTPTARDFDRFNFYAPRVRKLEVRQYSRYYKEISECTYKELCAMNGGDPLLPNVHTLIWRSEYQTIDDPADLMRCYMTASVTSLILSDYDYTTDKIITGLKTLPSYCPNLQNLALNLDLLRLDVPSLVSYVQSWDYTPKVTLDLRIHPLLSQYEFQMRPELLSRLASIPRLCKLKFTPGLITKLTYARGIAEDTALQVPLTFPSMDTLLLNAGSAFPCASMLEDCRFPVMKHLDIFSSPLLVRALPSVLGGSVSSSILETLIIRTPPYFNTTETRDKSGLILNFDTLRPLLEFHNLHHLVVRLTNNYSGSRLPGISLTDTDWEVMTREWPRLRTLDIVGVHSAETAPGFVGPTHKAFAHIVRHCPDLQEVGLFIAHSTGSERELDELPVSKTLVSLKLYHSNIEPEQYQFTASWIKRMFPRVRTISRWGLRDAGPMYGQPGEYERVWEDMMRRVNDEVKPSE